MGVTPAREGGEEGRRGGKGREQEGCQNKLRDEDTEITPHLFLLFKNIQSGCD